MHKIINKYKTLLYLAILVGEVGNIGEIYSIDINELITIDDSTKGNNVATDLTNTNYNYWSKEEDNTYVFNRDPECWQAYNTVTIYNGYTLKLITTGYDYYYVVLDCYNTFTNNGNVIIDQYCKLSIDYSNNTIGNTISDSNNNGTIDIINGELGLCSSATLNNKGTITLKGSSYIDINSNSTLTNKGTIDISNIKNLSKWYNNAGTFELKRGSTFILPKSIPTPNSNSFKITLNGTPNNKVIFKYYTHEPYIDNNIIKIRHISDALTYNSLDDINTKTGFTFSEDNRDNVSFIPIDKYTLSDILTIDNDKYNSTKYTLDISQLGIIPTIDNSTTINTKLIIHRGYTLTVNTPITVNSNWDVKGTIKGSSNITYTKGSNSTVRGGNIRGNVRLKGGKIVFK